MSIRISTASWIAGATVVGKQGFGVLAQDIPSTGDVGPAYAYDSLSFPADQGKEICGRITTWPISGTLTASEDTSFTYVPAGDGATSFAWQLYVDGVATGAPVTMPLTVGTSQVSRATVLSYAVRSAVSGSATLGYSVKASISASTAVAYAVRASISASTAVAYAVRASISASTTLSYNILSSTSVSSNIALAYGIRAAVTSSSPLAYAVRIAASQSTPIAYGVREPVSAATALSYAIAGPALSSVTAASTLAYSVRAVVTANQELAYALAGSTSNGTLLRYNILGLNIYPDASQVLAGVSFGPTGVEYLGTAVVGTSTTVYNSIDLQFSPASEGQRIKRRTNDTYADTVVLVDPVSQLPVSISGYTFTLSVDKYRFPPSIYTKVFEIVGQIVDADAGIVAFQPTALQAATPAGTYYYDIQATDPLGRKRTLAVEKYIFVQDIGG